ncbi:MAG TPA: hypothetical protein VFM18_07430, partial [Methanosarcina sp.]|nr:hypothetical protein [Methanosarcina sp.]
MSSFTVPIQERDNTPLQDAPLPTENQSIVTPVQGDLGASNFDKMANVLQQQQITAQKRMRITAMHNIENQRDAIVDDANSKIVSAQGENAFSMADQVQKDTQAKFNQIVQNAPEMLRGDAENIVNQGINRINKVSQGH